MDDENLKDLKKLLSQDQIRLSNIIDKIEYHFRDNTFHFIFNVSNNFLSGKSRLYVNQWYINIFIDILKCSIYEGSYIIEEIKL